MIFSLSRSYSSTLLYPFIPIRRAYVSHSLHAQLKQGDIFTKERAFSHEEVVKYAELSQDRNPIHLDSERATEAGFKDAVVHGMLYAGLFPSIIAYSFVSDLTQFLNLV